VSFPRLQFRRLAALLVAILVVVLSLAFPNTGKFLVVDNREKSDAIVVTQADSLDTQYWFGMHLLEEGYGRELLLDSRTDRIFFGRSQAEWANDFLAKTAGRFSGQVKVCPIAVDTTSEEVYEVENCLKGRSIRSVLLVVADFHSHRSQAIFSRLLPGYHWTIAAIPDAGRFDVHWWRKRVWIRTALIEWQHFLWWELLDRWRYSPVPVDR